MLKKNEGIDIVKELGGIQTVEEAQALFEQRLDTEHLARIRRLRHPDVLIKIANSIAMCDPGRVYINTGTDADRAFIRQLALNKGEEAVLAMDGHTIHYDLKEEQGRIIDRTYYIANPDEKISSLANKILRDDARTVVREKMAGIMNGATMVVGLYIRGPVGAAASNPALEITSSAYVSHSAEILYRNAFDDFEKEVERLGHFYTNVHSEGLNRPEDLPNARVFMDRSHRTTYSFNCTYAGNTLLLKKGNHRFSVDKAVYEGKGLELAEHMFITGIDGPGGRVTWVAGAAPSGCGKTTTAMAGNHFVGDDLAQMWIDGNNSVRSINPECGIFGIVEDVNREGDPMLMDRLRNPGSEVIWSNVLIDEDGVPHWKGNGGNASHSRPQLPWPLEKGAGRCRRQGSSHFAPQRPLHHRLIGPGQLFGHGRSRGRRGNPGDYLQRPGQRHHAPGVGRKEFRPRRGHRRLHRFGGHGYGSGGHGRQKGAVGQCAFHSRRTGRLHESAVRFLRQHRHRRQQTTDYGRIELFSHP